MLPPLANGQFQIWLNVNLHSRITACLFRASRGWKFSIFIPEFTLHHLWRNPDKHQKMSKLKAHFPMSIPYHKLPIWDDKLYPINQSMSTKLEKPRYEFPMFIPDLTLLVSCEVEDKDGESQHLYPVCINADSPQPCVNLRRGLYDRSQCIAGDRFSNLC